jgi:inorganic pyrophosphatase/exopolyphosphatase
VLERLRRTCGAGGPNYDQLLHQRTDVSQLSVPQLLIRDLKVGRGFSISSVPVSLEAVLERDARLGEHLAELGRTRGVDVVMVMTSFNEGPGDHGLARQLLVFGEKADAVCRQLRGHKELVLEALPLGGDNAPFTAFRQRAIDLSRKQVLPIVEKIVAKM